MSKEQKEITYTLDTVDTVIAALLHVMKHAHIITFTGQLGAGKTTLVRTLLRACGIEETITSPTFTYVNVYTNQSGVTFYHFDLYRIETLDDFLKAGFDEYLHQPNSYVFIEWPAIIMPLLTNHVCHCEISYDMQHIKRRTIAITCL